MRILPILAIFALPLLAQNAASPILTGATLPLTCMVNTVFFKTAAPGGIYFCTAPNTYSATAFVSPGYITMILSGTCPYGFSEATALNGKTLIGTLAANNDVGATGGSDTLTPAGTVAAPVFTGSALGTHLHAVGTYAAAAPTFTGSAAQVTSATSGGTPAGTNGSVNITPLGTNGSVNITPLGSNAASATTGNCAATNLAIGTGATTACKATAPNLTVAAQTFTGSSTTVGAQTFTGSTTTVGAQTFTGSPLATHTHTLTPAGTNSAPSLSGSSEAITAGTPAGTNNAPAFTGSSADNRSAFVKVIFCTKD